MREKNHIAFDDDINWSFKNEIENGKMGIKTQYINSGPYDIKKIAVIRMDLDLKKIIKVSFSNKKKIEDFIDGNDFHKYLDSNIIKFSNQIEKFILRGMEIIDNFDINELNDNQTIDSFFDGPCKESDPINDLKRDLYGAILQVKNNLRSTIYNYEPPFLLMSDCKPHTDAEITYYNGKNLIEIIEKEYKIKWLDLSNDADKENDHKLVCIPKEDPMLQISQYKISSTFYLIEKKENPINVYCSYNRIIIYWGGALKIKKPESIQRLLLNYGSEKKDKS